MRTHVGLAIALGLCASVANGQVLLRSEGGEATGTTVDPSGEPSRTLDLRGLSIRRESARRTPSGFLNPHPFEPVVGRPLGDDWAIRGSLEAGYLGAIGDDARDGQARYSKYTDWSSGFWVRGLELGAREPEHAVTLDFRALNLGRDDALYVGRFSADRWIRIDGFHSELPHPSMNDATSLYRGDGGPSLRLPDGPTPGGSTGSEIDAALADRSPSSLRLERERSGVDLVLTPFAGWRFSAAYRLERKEGERASGGSMFFGFLNPNIGSVIELPLPVDHRTHDLSVRVAYAQPLWNASLGYDLSLFENSHESLTWENPFGGLQPIAEGRLALEPDNRAQGISGDLAIQLPWRARFTSRVAWRSMRQNESLLAPTVNPVLPDWNTVAALSQRKADSRVNTLLIHGELSLQPVDPIRVRLHLRYDERDRHSSFSSANPLLTDVSGYIAEDGGAGLAPQLRLGPSEFDRERLRGGAEFQLRADPKTALQLSYLRDATRRSARERNRVAEDQLRAELTSRSIPWLTIRGSYTYTHRSGSPYRPDPNAQSFRDAGGTPPRSAPESRKLDLADRDRHEIALRLSVPLGDVADLSLSGRYRDDDYAAGLGLQSDRSGDLTLDLFYQPSPRLQLSGYASYERRKRSLDGRNLAVATPDAGRWRLNSDASTTTAGASIEASLHEWVRWSLAYDWIRSVEEQPYRFDSTAALSPFGGPSRVASGDSFPDLRLIDHRLETSLRVGPRDPWSLRVFYRYAASRIDDFQQADLPTRSDQRLFFGHQDRSFDAHAIGATVELRY